MVLTVIMLFAGLLAASFGGIAWQRQHSMKAARTVPVSGLLGLGPDDAPCAIIGTAEADGATLTAPMSGRPCAWYRAVTEEYWTVRTRNGPSRRTLVLDSDTSPGPVRVRDATGVARVHVAGASKRYTVASFSDDVPSSLPARDGRYSRRVTHTEEIIPEGHRLYVLGTPRPDPDEDLPVMTREGGGQLVVSTLSEADVGRLARLGAGAGLVTGAVLILVALGILVTKVMVV